MSSKPTFIFIPGAWHTPLYFMPTTKLLSSPPYSYPCIPITLPSVHQPESPVLQSIDPDVEVVRQTIETVLETGSDVVVVMHSYGGVVGMESMKYFKEAEAGKGRVLRCVWVAAFVMGVGRSLMDELGGDLIWFDVAKDKQTVLATNSQEIFYNDMSHATSAFYMNGLRPHSYQTFHSKLTYSPLATIPSTYVICEIDYAISAAVQESMIEKAKASVEKGRKVVPFDVVERIAAGHTPFVSQPVALVEILGRAATG